MVFLMSSVTCYRFASNKCGPSVPSSRALLRIIGLTACLSYFSIVADRELTGLFNQKSAEQSSRATPLPTIFLLRVPGSGQGNSSSTKEHSDGVHIK
ncbi:hypothetical protein BDR03DRAFT_245932 [Suillus americanus]|nr:hypothetical protein BDR03DRAFT_245932 [Suillus americanus]